MTYYGTGSWGLPEFGLTEKLGGNKNSITPGMSVGTPTPSSNTVGMSVGTPSYTGTMSSTGSGSSYKKSSLSNKSSGGSSKSSAQKDAERAQKEAEDRARKEISSGWDDYIASLDQQYAGLNGQRSSQEEIVNSQYNQGVNTLGLQREQGLQSLDKNRQSAEQNQVKNLRDISSNIRNAFMAGNVYLGSRGAGDSSAADQYSYALGKVGTQQRSDVMGDTANIMADIDARETNLDNMYNTEVNNLEQQKNAQIQQVASWFADAQNQVRMAKSQGQLGKSQDLASLSRTILDQAMNQINQINQYNLNQRQALDQWAMGVSDNITSLKANMQGVTDVSYSMPQAESMPGMSYAGNVQAGYFPGSSYGEDKTKGLFSGFSNLG